MLHLGAAVGGVRAPTFDKFVMESIGESLLFLGGSTGALAWRWWFARLDLDSRLGKWKDASESISKIVRFHGVTSQLGC